MCVLSAPAEQVPARPEHPASLPHTPPRLYLPYGSLRAIITPRRLDVVHTPIHWFRVGRVEPVVPYERLILGYRTLPQPAKTQAERVVDEFFSEEEFRLLRAYLRDRHHEDLRTSVLMAPVNYLRPDAASRLGARRPFGMVKEAPGKEAHGVYRMSEEVGYSLPFAVSGFYLTGVVSPASAGGALRE
jgi:hypothetical protein